MDSGTCPSQLFLRGGRVKQAGWQPASRIPSCPTYVHSNSNYWIQTIWP